MTVKAYAISQSRGRGVAVRVISAPWHIPELDTDRRNGWPFEAAGPRSVLVTAVCANDRQQVTWYVLAAVRFTILQRIPLGDFHGVA